MRPGTRPSRRAVGPPGKPQFLIAAPASASCTSSARVQQVNIMPLVRETDKRAETAAGLLFHNALLMDGKASTPEGRSARTLIPPAFGLAGVNLTYVRRMGVGHALERFRGRAGDAGQGHVLRSEARGCVKTSDNRRKRVRRCAPRARPGDAGAGGIASISARAAGARGAAGQLRRSRRATRRSDVRHRQPRSLRAVPLAAAVHRARVEPAHSGGDRDRRLSGGPWTGGTLPHDGLWTRSRGGYYHDGRFATLLEVVGHGTSWIWSST